MLRSQKHTTASGETLGPLCVRMSVALATCLGAALSAAQVPVATKVVRVLVYDVRSQTAIPDVELFALNGALLAHGDSAGVLQVRIKEQTSFNGQLRRAGYVASSVRVTGLEAGDSTVVLLAPTSAQSLRGLNVRARNTISRYADFDRRRLSGREGIFLTDSQIVKGGHILFTDLFRRFSSLRVADSLGVSVVTSARMQKPTITPGKPLDLGPCAFRIVVDDLQMAWGFDLNMLNRDEVHGIEIYSGPATIPPEFGSMRKDAMCGMIVIWTKIR